jgi:hypothetical protein
VTASQIVVDRGRRALSDLSLREQTFYEFASAKRCGEQVDDLQPRVASDL